MRNKKISLFVILAVIVLAVWPSTTVQAEELLTLDYPVGGEEFSVGEQITIKWQYTGIIPQVYLAVLGYDSKTPSSINDTCAFVNLTPTPISNNGSYNWMVQVGRLDGGVGNNCPYYKIAIYKAPDYATMDVTPDFFTVKAASGTTPESTMPTTPVSTGAHGAGTNVLGTDGTVYRIESYSASKSPYTSDGAFLSYKFNTWAGVVKANAADMALPLTSYTPSGASQPKTYYIPPRNGSLIVDNGTVYLITGGLRAGFTSEAVFTSLGYSFKYVYPGDTSFMESLPNISDSNIMHPSGTLINDNGALYVMQYGKRYGFPDMAILDSWGYWVEDAVPANEYDKQAPVADVLRLRMVNQMNI